MDLLYFFHVFKQRLWLILLASILAMGTVYALKRDTIKNYKSWIIIATGIISRNSESGAWVQDFKLQSDFNQLISMFTSRAMLNALSRRLVSDELSGKINFRLTKEIREKYSNGDLNLTLDAIRTANDSSFALLPISVQQTVESLAKELRYNEESLRGSVWSFRLRDTDNLQVEAVSEHPGLSAYMVTTLCQMFMEAHTKKKNESSVNTVNFYKNLVSEKKAALDQKTDAYKQFKLNNNASNLEDQTKSTLDEIRRLELQREEERKKIPSYEKTLANIDKYSGQNAQGVATKTNNNSRISSLRERINQLNNDYIGSGYKNYKLKQEADKLKTQLDTEIARINKRSGFAENESNEDEPVSGMTKQELASRRMDTEEQLELARTSVQSLDNEIQRLKGNVTGLVSQETSTSSFEREIEVLHQEYVALLEKLNAAEFAAINAKTANNTLQIVENALPAKEPEPNRTVLLVILAGIATFSLSTFALLALVYIDDTIAAPYQLRKHTRNLPLLEVLNNINVQELHLEMLFSQMTTKGDMDTFKQLARSIRFKIENMTATRTILFTSLKKQEGKTFAMVTLAYALCLNNKKVLLLDANFKNNAISRLPVDVRDAHFLTDAIKHANMENVFTLGGRLFQNAEARVDVIACRASGLSASELLGNKNVRAFVTNLRRYYDYVLIEGAALNHYTDSKELANAADAVVAVLSAQTSISNDDQGGISYMHDLRHKFIGIILNKLNLKNLI